MIVIFSLEPRSAVTAYMLSRLNGAKPALFDHEKQYFFDEVTDARTADFDELYQEYREKFGKLDFLEDMKLYDIIKNDIFWALRFKALDNARLIMQALSKIEELGTKSYLSEGSPEAKEMRFRVKRVLSEFNRALRYVRFKRIEALRLSIAKASFENDIVDMVMRGEALRNQPGTTVAVHDEKSVFILINGQPYIARKTKIPLQPERKDFERFWSGLPGSAKNLILKDEMHELKEMPQIALPKSAESAEVPKTEIISLDSFTT